MEPLIVVTGAGFLAGAMNALAGGGSFVSLPALIAAGLPPVQANASSTVALFPGGVVSAWAYRDGLSPVGPVSLRAMLVITVIGGLIGAALLLRTSSSTFSFLLPWLMLCASLALAFGRTLGEALRRRWRIGAPSVLAIQLALGIYGGYFGGAVGIMMMAVWGLLDARDLKSLNAPRTLLVSAANSVAVVTFALAHAVRWPEDRCDARRGHRGRIQRRAAGASRAAWRHSGRDAAAERRHHHRLLRANVWADAVASMKHHDRRSVRNDWRAVRARERGREDRVGARPCRSNAADRSAGRAAH